MLKFNMYVKITSIITKQIDKEHTTSNKVEGKEKNLSINVKEGKKAEGKREKRAGKRNGTQ